MRNLFINKILLFALPIILSLLVLALSVRGITGTPSAKELNEKKWIEGPLELSPERGRYALLYSFVEDKSLVFSVDIARFATPDVGIHDGKYVSLFAPLVSFTVLPGYVIGKLFGIAQVGAYATIACFALFNILLIRSIGIHLGASKIAATVSGMIFVFASPAFSYGVSLFQHHISTFLMLSILYLALRFKSWFILPISWLFYALAIMIDYPNALLFLPIIIYIAARILWVEAKARNIFLHVKPLYLLTLLVVIFPAVFYAWFSQNSYGSPFQLSGTVQSVQAIDENGKPVSKVKEDPISSAQRENEAKSKEAVSFFKTRNILNGLYVHIFSPDRGMLYYAPALLLGLFGILVLWKKNRKILSILLGIVGINVVLYSMWGDPWGGWAFGSRYLIPSYAILAILLSMAATSLRRRFFFILAFIIVSVYSIWVNSLGALTSSANPPQVEVLALEQQTGKPEKYTYERNWEYLLKNGSKSYVYRSFLTGVTPPVVFYMLIAGTISLSVVMLILINSIRRKDA